MKKKQMITTAVLMVITGILFTNCSTLFSSSPETQEAQQQSAARRQAVELAKPIRASQGQRPAWVDEVPMDDAKLSFVGISPRFTTETQARNAAREDARRQLVDYYGTLMVNKGREAGALVGLSNEVFSPQIAAQQLNERIAQGAAQALGDRRFYWEYFMDESNREYYIVYAEMQIDKARVAKIIDDFGKQEAADLQKKAAQEQDARRRQQLEKAADFFGGNLSGNLEL